MVWSVGLAQFLVVAAAEDLGEVVERPRFFSRSKSSGAKRGAVSMSVTSFAYVGEVVAVDHAGEDGHLLAAGDVELGGHRVEFVEDLLIGQILRAAPGDHRGGEGGEAFLAVRVVLRAGPDDHAEGDQRARSPRAGTS